MRGRASLTVALLLWACANDEEPPDPTITTGYDQQPIVKEPCDGTEDCGDGFCAAPYVDTQTPLEFVCIPRCLRDRDNEQWCADNGACCGPRSYCDGRSGQCRYDPDRPDPGNDPNPPDSTGG